MAVSKNNRRKTKKRQQHMSPVKREERTAQPDNKSSLGIEWISFIGLILMVLGFVVAMFSDYGIVGYPVSFAGAAMSLSQTKWDTRRNKISIVSYIVYCAAVAYMWINILMGKQ